MSDTDDLPTWSQLTIAVEFAWGSQNTSKEQAITSNTHKEL